METSQVELVSGETQQARPCAWIDERHMKQKCALKGYSNVAKACATHAAGVSTSGPVSENERL